MNFPINGRKVRGAFGLIWLFMASVAAGGVQDWPCYGHFANRCSIAVDGPNVIDANTLVWDANADPQDPNYYVEFESATGPVVYDGKVYAYARYYNQQGEDTNSQIIAYDANDGRILWTGIVEKAYMDSWSSPCIDSKNRTVLIGSGSYVYAFDANNGNELWLTPLVRKIVNASICIADTIPYGRAFITDYKPYSTPEGRLYCINLDPCDAANPYQPGQIVWSQIIGTTSGNSPACKDGVVYVATRTGTANSTGTVYAYEAAAQTPNEIWQSSITEPEGFFGGVTVTKEGYLYTATYDYNTAGGENNSMLCKFDCNNGNIVWTTETERTDSIPVVVGAQIYISGGINGEYGSRPKIQAYRDDGGEAVKLWETPNDVNNPVGGWTHQPVYANGKLYVGAIKGTANNFSPYTDFYILDVSLTPADAGFVTSHYEGCGNSPAITCDSIYTTGRDGLFRFSQSGAAGDIRKDGKVDTLDLAELARDWLYDGPVGVKRCDLDLDGYVDFRDFALLAEKWQTELY